MINAFFIAGETLISFLFSEVFSLADSADQKGIPKGVTHAA